MLLFALLVPACAGDDDPVADDGAAAASTGSTGAGPAGSGETASGTDAGVSDGGTTADGGSSGAADGTSSVGDSGTALHAIVGHVHRDELAAIAEGNDGIGTLYVGVFPGCDPAAAIAGFAIVADADVSDPTASVDFTVMNLADGTYDVRVFLDDDGNADGLQPAPSPGDLVVDVDPTDAGATCTNSEVQAGDLELDLALNAVIPAG